MITKELADELIERIGAELTPQASKWDGWYREAGCSNGRELLGGLFISFGVVLLQDFDAALTKEKFLDIAGGIFDGTMDNISKHQNPN